jgi:hypothetical protein
VGGLASTVVLLLLGGFVLLGTPAGSLGTVSTAAGDTFYSARSASFTTTGGEGSWELYAATGVDFANASTVNLGLPSIANCTVTSLTGPPPSTFTYPAFTGNLLAGIAPDWDFDYFSPTTGNELAVLVEAGSVVVALELSGPGCSVPPTLFHSNLSRAVDSSTAATVIAAAGARDFVSAHPTGVSLQMLLIASFTSGNETGGGTWTFGYSTCSFSTGSNGTTAPGSSFVAVVNATTGALVPASSENFSCGGGTPTTEPIGTSLGFGPPTLTLGPGTGGTLASQGCVSGDYCYQVPIVASANNITPGDLDLEVINRTTQAQVPVVGYAVTDLTGAVVVYSVGSLETSWTDGAGSAVTILEAGFQVEVDFGPTHPSPANLSLVANGKGPFSGSIEVGLEP